MSQAVSSPLRASNPQCCLVVFLERLALQPAVLVWVESFEGSVPRETGAWMAVFEGALVGTVGGGHLELEAHSRAQAMLRASDTGGAAQTVRFALGPALGQCCGGVAHLRFECVGVQDIAALRRRLQPALQPVALFGGGHVGQALVQLLATLPFDITWIDSRDGVFAEALRGCSAGQLLEKMHPLGGQKATQSEQTWGPNVSCEHSEPVQSAVQGLAAQSRVLIMSFSHAEDLDVVSSCLQRQRERADLPYIGLIGSKTKWATFQRRLQARGFTPNELAHVTSPIGIAGITGKAPEVIAVAVAAQLLQIAANR